MDFVTSLIWQTWSMYAVGVLLVAGRIASRCLTERSIFRLWWEEYIMLFVTATYTVFSWAIPQIAIYGSNYLSPDAVAALTDDGIRQAIYGSKMTMVVEVATLATIWGCKGCLCLMFYRLTSQLGSIRIAVRCIAAYCASAFVFIMLMYLCFWCKPIWGYWAVPVVESECATYYHHMIFATAWNVFADLMLLVIPLRLLPTLQIPFKQKLLLVCVLCLGVFNILAAILNRYYNFSHPDSLEYTRWYVGEVGTSIYVVNIPALRPLLQKVVKVGTTLGATSNTGHCVDAAHSHSYAMQRLSATKGTIFSGHRQAGPVSESEENLALHGTPQWDIWNGVMLSRSEAALNVSKHARGQRGQDVKAAPAIFRTVEVSKHRSEHS